MVLYFKGAVGNFKWIIRIRERLRSILIDYLQKTKKLLLSDRKFILQALAVCLLIFIMAMIFATNFTSSF